MKVQVAFEYIIIIAIGLAFIIPIWLYIITVQYQSNVELALSYAKNAVDKIASTADLVYSQGTPAKVRVSVYIPNGVVQSNITNNTIYLTVRVGTQLSDVVAISEAELNGSLPTQEGNYLIDIEAKADYVQITY